MLNGAVKAREPARQIGYSGAQTMPKKPIIPFSPSEEDYLQQVAEAEPLPAITDTDPIALFAQWLEEALKKEPNDANAMTLATVDADGLPDARMVLLKGVDARGFTFFTNFESAKGRAAAGASEGGAGVPLEERCAGRCGCAATVAPVSAAEADAYFATRARSAQIGAWASDQSRELPDRLALERRIAEMGLKFGLGQVPRPPHWSGFRLAPAAHRVLARPAVPPARAARLRPRRRRLDGAEALSVSAPARRPCAGSAPVGSRDRDLLRLGVPARRAGAEGEEAGRLRLPRLLDAGEAALGAGARAGVQPRHRAGHLPRGPHDHQRRRTASRSTATARRSTWRWRCAPSIRPRCWPSSRSGSTARWPRRSAARSPASMPPPRCGRRAAA